MAAIEEAVTLRRSLTAARPDAHTPDLASSLSVMGDVLENNKRLGDAVIQDREAIVLLAPFFFNTPHAFEAVMKKYRENYVRRAQTASMLLDEPLLKKIAGFLI